MRGHSCISVLTGCRFERERWPFGLSSLLFLDGGGLAVKNLSQKTHSGSDYPLLVVRLLLLTGSLKSGAAHVASGSHRPV